MKPSRFLSNENAAPMIEQLGGTETNSRVSSTHNDHCTMDSGLSDTCTANSLVPVESKPNRIALFQSSPGCVAQLTNTSFAKVPTLVSEAQALNFFRHDHTPISFKGGHSHGDNFWYARAIPFDIDNSHSDNPEDWITPEAMRGQLEELDINYCMVASRNHMLSKDGKAPRPKFHVYLPLSELLHDSDKFVRYCLWCIRTFGSDDKVKSKAQKMFGFGNNPHAFVGFWSDGYFIDEIISDDDLAAVDVAEEPRSNAPPVIIPSANMPEIERRAIAYIGKMPPAIQGCNGSADALKVCNKLYEFGLDRETARNVFTTHYNPRCKPPWSEREIDHKLDTAYSKPLKPPGSMSARASGNTQNVDRKEDWKKIFSKAMTATDIANTEFPELRWVVDDLIPEGLTILAGQSKIGKSWFLLQMALCVASGSPFLGTFNANPASVLYIALEDNARRIQNRMEKLGMQTSEKLIFLYEWQDNSDALDYYLEAYPTVKVVIIDTWGRYVTGACKDGNDYNEVTSLAGRLHTIAKNHNAAIIVCTPTRKGASAGDWFDDIIGSMALPSVADTILKLSRERNNIYGVLNISGRDVFERDVALEHSDNWVWSIAAHTDLTDQQRKIVSYLRRNPTWQSQRVIQQNVAGYSKEGGADKLDRDLLVLLKMGIVVRQGYNWAIKDGKSDG